MLLPQTKLQNAYTTIFKRNFFNMNNFYNIHKHRFYIDYPQEKLDGELYKYKCAFCGIDTVTIDGMLENHSPTCEYRLQKENDANSDT